MEIVDIQAITEIAHQHNAIVIVDNIFASPVLQKPMEFDRFWQVDCVQARLPLM